MPRIADRFRGFLPVVVDVETGEEAGACTFPYPTGHQGVVLDPRDHNLARQHPADYLAGLEASVTGALRAASTP